MGDLVNWGVVGAVALWTGIGLYVLGVLAFAFLVVLPVLNAWYATW